MIPVMGKSSHWITFTLFLAKKRMGMDFIF